MPEAAGQGTLRNAAAPVAAAGQGAAPVLTRVDAMRALLALPEDPSNKFEALYEIFARARPPIPWLGDPTSAEYREVFEGLDPRVPVIHPEMANGGDFGLNRVNAYMRLRLPQGGRRTTRKPKRKGTRRLARRKSQQ